MPYRRGVSPRRPQCVVPTCEIVKMPIQLLALCFFQFLPNFGFFATNVAEMVLEKR
jgi:hypothetical protein